MCLLHNAWPKGKLCRVCWMIYRALLIDATKLEKRWPWVQRTLECLHFVFLIYLIIISYIFIIFFYFSNAFHTLCLILTTILEVDQAVITHPSVTVMETEYQKSYKSWPVSWIPDGPRWGCLGLLCLMQHSFSYMTLNWSSGLLSSKGLLTVLTSQSHDALGSQTQKRSWRWPAGGKYSRDIQQGLYQAVFD